MASIDFVKCEKSFGSAKVLKGIDLQIASGEFLVLVGPSGCGKSTLLRSLAGLEKLDAGSISVGGKIMNDIEPQNRDIAMVFQSYALYPHMSVAENMGFSLKLQGLSAEEISRRVKEISDLLQISHLLERKPKELSGGQRQRVALGRALSRQTPVILFDEPLSNLDAHLRSQMRVEIKRLHQALKSTMIYVTHDQMEATTMGDRIAVLRDGVVEQIGTPTEIYHRPKNMFIASFIGSPEMNFMEGSILSKLPWPEAKKPGQVLGVRPESMKPATGSLEPHEIALGDYHVELSENLGGQQMLHGKLDGQSVRMLVDSMDNFSIGQRVPLKIDLTKAHLFDKATGLNQRL
ncbi:ABC transporter ATP-binding protein [Bdellovibrio svalbardensis]|uniref:ABC transporter ATP-binding protein n=1 Tax=Bdellovibrio svalbardensis TaxID=2972972 RepID=A0ABT6DK95_9BACT|nr:ABC transporter ATP-binding protein [Bdellovibrio svalbardensis]MDG0817228.1 ABC transporter ATP-binding protein [Bdellovibrio svalbardensis]